MYHIYDSLFEPGFSTAWPSPHHCWLCEHGQLPFCRRLLSSGCRIRRQKENPQKSEVENKSKTSSHFGSPLSYPPLFFLSSLNSISLLICPLLHFIIPQKVIQAGFHEGNSSPPKVSSSVFFHRVTSWSNDKGAHPVPGLLSWVFFLFLWLLIFPLLPWCLHGHDQGPLFQLLLFPLLTTPCYFNSRFQGVANGVRVPTAESTALCHWQGRSKARE